MDPTPPSGGSALGRLAGDQQRLLNWLIIALVVIMLIVVAEFLWTINQSSTPSPPAGAHVTTPHRG
jgi:hypothetical protein